MSNILNKLRVQGAETKAKGFERKFTGFEDNSGQELLGFGVPEVYLNYKYIKYFIDAENPTDLNVIYNQLIDDGIHPNELVVEGNTITSYNGLMYQNNPTLVSKKEPMKEIIEAIGKHFKETRLTGLKGLGYDVYQEYINEESLLDKEILTKILEDISAQLIETYKPENFHLNATTLFLDVAEKPGPYVQVARYDIVEQGSGFELSDIVRGVENRIDELTVALEYIDKIIQDRLESKEMSKADNKKDHAKLRNIVVMNLTNNAETCANNVSQLSDWLNRFPLGSEQKEDINYLERFRGDYEPLVNFNTKIQLYTKTLEDAKIDSQVRRSVNELQNMDTNYSSLRQGIYKAIQLEKRKVEYLNYLISNRYRTIDDYFINLA